MKKISFYLFLIAVGILINTNVNINSESFLISASISESYASGSGGSKCYASYTDGNWNRFRCPPCTTQLCRCESVSMGETEDAGTCN